MPASKKSLVSRLSAIARRRRRRRRRDPAPSAHSRHVHRLSMNDSLLAGDARTQARRARGRTQSQRRGRRRRGAARTSMDDAHMYHALNCLWMLLLLLHN